MALLGLLIGGLGTACWLRHLEAALPGHDSAARVLQKAALDACVWAPLANSGYLVLTPLLVCLRAEVVEESLQLEFVVHAAKRRAARSAPAARAAARRGSQQPAAAGAPAAEPPLYSEACPWTHRQPS